MRSRLPAGEYFAACHLHSSWPSITHRFDAAVIDETQDFGVGGDLDRSANDQLNAERGRVWAHLGSP